MIYASSDQYSNPIPNLITESLVCKELQARQMVIVRLSTETGPSFLEVEGFEEKQAQGEKKHEAVYGGTEVQFP